MKFTLYLWIFKSKCCWMCSGDWCHRSYQIHNRYASVSCWLCCSHWQELGYIWFLTFCFWIPGMNCRSNWFHSLQFCLIHNSSSCHEIYGYILSLILKSSYLLMNRVSISGYTGRQLILLLVSAERQCVQSTGTSNLTPFECPVKAGCTLWSR